MKKQILLAVSAAILSTLAMAQQPTFGVRAGVISSGMGGNAVSNLKNLMDFTKDKPGFPRLGWEKNLMLNMPRAIMFSEIKRGKKLKNIHSKPMWATDCLTKKPLL